jgi:hypothetical protein
MFIVALFVIAVLTTLVKTGRTDPASRDTAYLFWGEVLMYVAGIGMIFAGVGHAYFQERLAPSIGWQPSPFEFELGWFEIGLGCAGVLSLWRSYDFRLAVTLPFAIFLLGSAAQHIDEMIRQHNYAPNNAGVILWFGDIFIPLLFLVLVLINREHANAERPTSSYGARRSIIR